jgi:YHS domain-containing protein
MAFEKDSVCGTQVNSERSKDYYIYEGKTYYFCSEHCKDEFAKTHKKYVSCWADIWP